MLRALNFILFHANLNTVSLLPDEIILTLIAIVETPFNLCSLVVRQLTVSSSGLTGFIPIFLPWVRFSFSEHGCALILLLHSQRNFFDFVDPFFVRMLS